MAEKVLLFEFLLRQYTSPQEQSALRELQAFAIKEETGFEQASDLFLEILKIIEPSELPAIENMGVENIIEPVVYIDVNMVGEHLLQYFETLAVPEVFEAQAKLIKEELLNPNKATKPFEEILDEVVQLLIEIKEYSDADQQDIDQFLLHIAVQLSELNFIVTPTNSNSVN